MFRIQALNEDLDPYRKEDVPKDASNHMNIQANKKTPPPVADLEAIIASAPFHTNGGQYQDSTETTQEPEEPVGGVATRNRSSTSRRGKVLRSLKHVLMKDNVMETPVVASPTKNSRDIGSDRTEESQATANDSKAFTTPGCFHTENDESQPETCATAVQTSKRTKPVRREKVLKFPKNFISPTEDLGTPQATSHSSYRQAIRKGTNGRSSKPTVTPSLDQCEVETPTGCDCDEESPPLCSTSDMSFPEIIHMMVTETAVSHPKLIKWIADGEAFVVLDDKVGVLLQPL